MEKKPKKRNSSFFPTTYHSTRSPFSRQFLVNQSSRSHFLNHIVHQCSPAILESMLNLIMQWNKNTCSNLKLYRSFILEVYKWSEGFKLRVKKIYEENNNLFRGKIKERVSSLYYSCNVLLLCSRWRGWSCNVGIEQTMLTPVCILVQNIFTLPSLQILRISNLHLFMTAFTCPL